MENIEFMTSEAESIFEICKNQEDKAALVNLEDLCHFVEKMVINEDEIEIVQAGGESSYKVSKVKKIFNFF